MGYHSRYKKRVLQKFEREYIDSENAVGGVEALKAIESDFKSQNNSITENPKLMAKILRSEQIPGHQKLEFLEVFLKSRLPHDLKIKEATSYVGKEGTLLELAVELGQKEVVQRLLEYGENIDQRSDRNANILSIAALAKNESMFDWLLEKGLKPVNNASLVCWALAGGHEGIIQGIRIIWLIVTTYFKNMLHRNLARTSFKTTSLLSLNQEHVLSTSSPSSLTLHSVQRKLQQEQPLAPRE